MQEVYEQVLITCTTINVLILIYSVVELILLKVSDHRRKKKEAEKQKQVDKQ